MARNRVEYKKNNSRGGGSVLLILALMLLIVGIHSFGLWKKQTALTEQREQLAAQIEAEQKRTEELSQLRKYVKTDSYAQEIAQDKLGLVHEGEIVFEIEKK